MTKLSFCAKGSCFCFVGRFQHCRQSSDIFQSGKPSLIFYAWYSVEDHITSPSYSGHVIIGERSVKINRSTSCCELVDRLFSSRRFGVKRKEGSKPTTERNVKFAKYWGWLNVRVKQKNMNWHNIDDLLHGSVGKTRIRDSDWPWACHETVNIWG